MEASSECTVQDGHQLIFESSDYDSVLTELSDDRDLPILCDEHALLRWLVSTTQQLKKILRQSTKSDPHPKRPYARKGLRRQSSRQERRDRQKAREDAVSATRLPEAGKLTQWFSRQSPSTPMEDKEARQAMGVAMEQQEQTDPDNEGSESDFESEVDGNDSGFGSSALVGGGGISLSSPKATWNQIECEEDGLGDLPEHEGLLCSNNTLQQHRIGPATPLANPAYPTCPHHVSVLLMARVQFSLAPAPIRAPPTQGDVQQGMINLQQILKPPRKRGRGYINPAIDLVLRGRLESMQVLMRLFKRSGYTRWEEASELAAKAAGRGPWLARRLREWTRAFLKDSKKLPVHQYGRWNSSILADEDLSQEIHLHLQSLGPYVSAMDIVRFMDSPEMRTRLDIKKSITLRTAQRWMRVIGYRWRSEPKGQYKDGHERVDVVDYRQNVFLPRMSLLEHRLRHWFREDGTEIEWEGLEGGVIGCREKPVVLWCHDESIFYGNDRRKIRWVHKTESAKPWVKGEGASVMVADFVSADYGWLRSLDECVVCYFPNLVNF
jgi:hypothetical protein